MKSALTSDRRLSAFRRIILVAACEEASAEDIQLCQEMIGIPQMEEMINEIGRLRKGYIPMKELLESILDRISSGSLEYTSAEEEISELLAEIDGDD